jgi:hypothetical protein
MQAISGNTFPVKDQIRALGGRWNPDSKVWMVPDERVAEARAIVSGAKYTTNVYRPRKCRVCGCVEGQRNSRGYVDGDRILRSGECQSCYEERKMGY